MVVALLASTSSQAGPSVRTISDISSVDNKIFQNINRHIEEKRKNSLLNKNKSKKTSDIPKYDDISLHKLLNLKKGDKGYLPNDKLIELTVAISFERVKREIQNGSMSATIDKKGKGVVYDRNGKKLTDEDIKKHNQSITQESKRYVAKKKIRVIKALKIFKINNKNLVASKFIDKAIQEGKYIFNIELKKENIEKFIDNNPTSLIYVELQKQIETKVADAMDSTNIDPYAINYGRTGSGIGIFIRDINCPHPTHITNYTRLSGNCAPNPNDNCPHSRNVTAIARAVSPDSHIYCSTNAITDTQRLNVQVESYSIGNADVDNIYGAWDANLDNEAYDENIPVFAAAGNFVEGNNNTWNVGTPAKGLNTITIGNYDDDTDEIYLGDPNNNLDNGSAHLDPDIGINKPEISAPGRLINAGNVLMTGTSMAAPHAAAFAADLMGEYSWLKEKPYLLKAMLLSSSTKSISGDDSNSGSYRGNVGNRSGVGGLDFYNAYYGFYFYWWWGDFNYVASHDNGSINDKLEVEFHQWTGNDVRIAISWLNDGTFTLNEKKIGKDFDLYVYDPNGNEVGKSWSANNSYEIANFHTNMSGNYKVVIDLYGSDQDTDTPTYIGLSIN